MKRNKGTLTIADEQIWAKSAEKLYIKAMTETGMFGIAGAIISIILIITYYTFRKTSDPEEAYSKTEQVTKKGLNKLDSEHQEATKKVLKIIKKSK